MIGFFAKVATFNADETNTMDSLIILHPKYSVTFSKSSYNYELLPLVN